MLSESLLWRELWEWLKSDIYVCLRLGWWSWLISSTQTCSQTFIGGRIVLKRVSLPDNGPYPELQERIKLQSWLCAIGKTTVVCTRYWIVLYWRCDFGICHGLNGATKEISGYLTGEQAMTSELFQVPCKADGWPKGWEPPLTIACALGWLRVPSITQFRKYTWLRHRSDLSQGLCVGEKVESNKANTTDGKGKNPGLLIDPALAKIDDATD